MLLTTWPFFQDLHPTGIFGTKDVCYFRIVRHGICHTVRPQQRRWVNNGYIIDNKEGIMRLRAAAGLRRSATSCIYSDLWSLKVPWKIKLCFKPDYPGLVAASILQHRQDVTSHQCRTESKARRELSSNYYRYEILQSRTDLDQAKSTTQ